jgi:hypothetical protein
MRHLWSLLFGGDGASLPALPGSLPA